MEEALKQEGQVASYGTFTLEFCLTTVAMILAAGLVVIALISPQLYTALIAEAVLGSHYSVANRDFVTALPKSETG